MPEIIKIIATRNVVVPKNGIEVAQDTFFKKVIDLIFWVSWARLTVCQAKQAKSEIVDLLKQTGGLPRKNHMMFRTLIEKKIISQKEVAEYIRIFLSNKSYDKLEKYFSQDVWESESEYFEWIIYGKKYANLNFAIRCYLKDNAYDDHKKQELVKELDNSSHKASLLFDKYWSEIEKIYDGS